MIQQIKKLSSTIISKMPNLSKQHREYLVKLFSVWLLIQGRHNIANISRYSSYSGSTISRRMGHGLDFGLFHYHTVCEVRGLRENTGWILGGDCSFIPKSGKKTYGRGLFWNGCISKQQKGLEISAYSLIHPQTKQAYMVDVEQTPGDLSDKEGGEEDYTRIDFYLQQLKRVHQRYYWIKYVALDGYYAKIKVFEFLETQRNEQKDESHSHLYLISKLRKDANLKFYLDSSQANEVHGNQVYDGKFASKDPMSQKEKWEELGQLEDEPAVTLYQARLYSPHYKRALNVVLCWFAEKEKHILLFSDDLELNGHLLVQYYKSRFQIEFLFRDAKQHTGLTHAQVRTKEKLDFHFNFCFATVNQSRIIAAQDADNNELSFNNAKRLGYNNMLLKQFIANSGIDPKLPVIQIALKETAEFGLMRA